MQSLLTAVLHLLLPRHLLQVPHCAGTSGGAAVLQYSSSQQPHSDGDGLSHWLMQLVAVAAAVGLVTMPPCVVQMCDQVMALHTDL